MRQNTEDKTLERNYQSKWRFLIKEHEQIQKSIQFTVWLLEILLISAIILSQKIILIKV